jgi:hypothetical protein
MPTRTKILKPVENNGQPNSKLQFNVAKDLDRAKKVKPTEVFNRKKVKLSGNPNKPKK